MLAKGYRVIGLDLPEENTSLPGIEYHSGSLAAPSLLTDLLLGSAPDEVYNLGSISHVARSFERPEETFATNLLPVIRALELLRHKLKQTKFLQASSSEMFGQKSAPPFNEESLIDPLSPYAVSKAAAYELVRIYRQEHGVFACNAILFNHTSPRHAADFFIAKIVKSLVAIKRGQGETLKVGNLDVEKDWGYAGDYVKAMAAILNYRRPDDYVVGTGRHLSLKAILDYVLSRLDLSYNKVVVIDPGLIRPNEPKLIYADPAKIKKVLGWKPGKSIEEVLDMMIEAEMKKQDGK